MRMYWFRIAVALAGALILGGCTAPPAPAPAPLNAVDIGFAQDMSMHHQQAITMADMVAPDAAPEIRALADQIRFTQLREIGQMTGWLQIAEAPVVSPHPMEWMMTGSEDHMAAGAMAMPGLASQADLTRLQRATGRANEVLFLQLMTRHHQGGIGMAAFAVAHTSTAAVHQTALGMIDEQSQELVLLASLLEQRDSAPLAYP
jgi:uncharacterized protein (DUF305 family)